MESLVRFRRVSKRFPGARALEDVTRRAPRVCHALCGENGAGKSTLGKLLAGIQQPDAGEIVVEGGGAASKIRATPGAPASAMVHQELAFCENLSVAENLCLGDLPTRGCSSPARDGQARGRADGRDRGALDVRRLVGDLTSPSSRWCRSRRRSAAARA